MPVLSKLQTGHHYLPKKEISNIINTLNHYKDNVVTVVKHNSKNIQNEPGQLILHLQKRTTPVSEGGPDMHSLGYVIAAVVVPLGLIGIVVVVLVMVHKKKRKDTKLIDEKFSIEDSLNEKESMPEQMQNRNNAYGISSNSNNNNNSSGNNMGHNSFLKKSNDNVEIKIVSGSEMDDSDYSNRKNRVLDIIGKSETNDLYSELHNNIYFSNYVNLETRNDAATLAMLKTFNINHPGIIEPIIKKPEVPEAPTDALKEDSSSNEKSKISTTQQSKTNSLMSVNDDEFYTPEDGYSPKESPEELKTEFKQDPSKLLIQPPPKAVFKENLAENICSHPLTSNDLPQMYNKLDFGEINTIQNGNDSMSSASSSVISSFTKSTPLTSVSGTLNNSLYGARTKLNDIKEDKSEDNVETFSPVNDSAQAKHPVRIGSLNKKKLEDVFEEEEEEEDDRHEYFDKYIDESESDDEDSDFEDGKLRANLLRFSVAGTSTSGNSSQRSERLGVQKLEDVKEEEEPITSPRPKYQLGKIDFVPLSIIEKATSNSVSSPENSNKEQSEDEEEDIRSEKLGSDELTATINDINDFLKQNGVYSSPVNIDKSKNVLSGLVISQNPEEGITNINGKNFSTDSLNKHLSLDSSYDVLMNNAVKINSQTNSPIFNPYASDNLIDSRISSPHARNENIKSNTSSIYDPVGKCFVSPILNDTAPQFHQQQRLAGFANTKINVVNSQAIPKAGNRSSDDFFDHQEYNLNAPVLSKETIYDSASTASLQSVNLTPSEKSNYSLKRNAAMQIKLTDRDLTGDKSPEQILQEKSEQYSLTDSEASFVHRYNMV